MKTIFCNQHCGVELYFSDTHVSKSGKKIPLEVKTNQPHKCPNSTYNSNPSQPTVATQTTGSVTPPVKTMDVVDFAADSMAKTMDVNIKIIHLAEQKVLEFLKSKGDANPNPQKVGMYVKLLMEMER